MWKIGDIHISKQVDVNSHLMPNNSLEHVS
jgi:hypothetical protein